MKPLRAALASSGAVVILLSIGASGERSVAVTEGTNVNVALSPDRKTIVMDLQEALWSLPIAGHG